MTYRSAQGKSIDMAKLRQQNENVRAVGNMNVNARGDTLDSHNRVVNDSGQRVNKMYQNAMMNGGRTPRRHEAQAEVARPTLQPDVTPLVQPIPVVEEPEFMAEELEFDMDLEEPVGKPPVAAAKTDNKSSKKA